MNTLIKLLFIVVGIAFVIACVFGGGWILMFLWNAVVPQVFHGPILTFWQGFFLSLLLWFVGGFFRSSSSSDK